MLSHLARLGAAAKLGFVILNLNKAKHTKHSANQIYSKFFKSYMYRTIEQIYIFNNCSLVKQSVTYGALFPSSVSKKNEKLWDQIMKEK